MSPKSLFPDGRGCSEPSHVFCDAGALGQKLLNPRRQRGERTPAVGDRVLLLGRHFSGCDLMAFWNEYGVIPKPVRASLLVCESANQ